MKRIITLILWLAATLVHAQLDAIRTLQPDQGQEVRRPVEAKIFGASQEELTGLEQELLAILKSMDTTLEGKQYACRMLRFCASDACVPVLAPKLTNADLSMFVRLVLQGLHTPAAEQALIEALSKAGNSEIKAGIIGTLGQHRGSPKSVKAIRPYLKNSNIELQISAITALGNMGGNDAAKALVKAKVNPELINMWIQAQLKCAGSLDAKNTEAAYRKFFAERYDEQIRAAALVGMTQLSPGTSADTVVAELKSTNACLKQTATGLLDLIPNDKLIARLPDLEPEFQIRVLEILSGRNAAEAEGAVLQLAANDNVTVRNAAYQALAGVGSAPSIELLTAKAPTDDAAFQALCTLQAEGADAAVIEAIQTAGDDKVKSKLLECIKLRKTTEALPLYVELAKGPWSRSCKAAIDGMATLVSETDFSSYAELLKNSDNPKKTEVLEQSIATAAQRLTDLDACARPLIEASTQAEGDVRYAFIRALGGIGSPEAKTVLTKAAASSDPDLKDAAIRGLANWPTIDVAPQLLEIATSADSEKYRVLALRGYIRLAEAVPDKTRALTMLYQAASATDRPAELKVIISQAKTVKEPAVTDFLILQLDNKDVFNEAGWAICEFATHWKTKQSALPVLERIAESATDERLADRARELLQQNNK